PNTTTHNKFPLRTTTPLYVFNEERGKTYTANDYTIYAGLRFRGISCLVGNNKLLVSAICSSPDYDNSRPIMKSWMHTLPDANKFRTVCTTDKNINELSVKFLADESWHPVDESWHPTSDRMQAVMRADRTNESDVLSVMLTESGGGTAPAFGIRVKTRTVWHTMGHNSGLKWYDIEETAGHPGKTPPGQGAGLKVDSDKFQIPGTDITVTHDSVFFKGGKVPWEKLSPDEKTGVNIQTPDGNLRLYQYIPLDEDWGVAHDGLYSIDTMTASYPAWKPAFSPEKLSSYTSVFNHFNSEVHLTT
ncbi:MULTISPECIES: hypothetical protein, partial [Streptomyces]|uniref:hypothetical protein n=1 Tax=Streptomyces TaxID=1883 RepID=UPI00345BD267